MAKNDPIPSFIFVNETNKTMVINTDSYKDLGTYNFVINASTPDAFSKLFDLLVIVKVRNNNQVTNLGPP
jgi:hypothetical protein